MSVAKSDIGVMVRRFRQRAGLGQLSLAHALGASQRHISFVETGRTRPSRDFLRGFAASIGLTVLDRNALLMAAGYAPELASNGERGPVEDRIMASARQLLAWQEPNPAMLLTDAWHLIAMNEPALRLHEFFCRDGHVPLEKGITLFDLVLDERMMRGAIVNIDAIAAYFESQMVHDAPEKVRRFNLGERLRSGVEPLALRVHMKRGDVEAHFLSGIVTVGTLRDAQVTEIRLESLYPADEASKAALAAIVSGSLSRG